MSNWTVADWLTYVPFILGALLLAVIQGGKDMTAPSWIPSMFSSTNWNYAPLALMLIGAAFFSLRQIGIIGNRSNAPIEQEDAKFQFDGSKKITTIAGKRFINEKVIQDGVDYRDCIFENVTFVFNGTAPIGMNGNTIIGRFKLYSQNPAVHETIKWLRGLGMLSEKLEVMLPPGVVVEPPTVVPGLPPNAQQ